MTFMTSAIVIEQDLTTLVYTHTHTIKREGQHANDEAVSYFLIK